MPPKFTFKKSMKNNVAPAPAANSSLNGQVAMFNAAIDQLDSVLVDRESEVEALKLCLASCEHLMLEGVPGTAKSRLATELFLRLRGVSSFKKQLTATTQPDEVFGCMNSTRYRAEAVWEYNTKDMLPQAHVAFLDEVYRVAESFLSNLFSVINERVFYNGGVVEACPLMTTIGTTNFTTLDEKLEAFHDRWLVKCKVNPLTSLKSKVRMLTLSLNPSNDAPKIVTLAGLRLIQEEVRKVAIREDVLSAYSEMVTALAKLTKQPISDRRLVQALRLAQASYVIDENRTKSFSEGYLSGTKFGLIVTGSEHETLFTDVFERVIGQQLKATKITEKLKTMLTRLEAMENEYDPSLPVEQVSEIYSFAARISNTLAKATSAELGASVANSDLKTELVNKSIVLANSAKQLLLKKFEVQAKADDEA